MQKGGDAFFAHFVCAQHAQNFMENSNMHETHPLHPPPPGRFLMCDLSLVFIERKGKATDKQGAEGLHFLKWL